MTPLEPKQEPVFNRDILANDDDLHLLSQLFAPLHPWLYWSELRDKFMEFEKAAAMAKGDSHKRGRKAVWWAFASVLIVSLSPVAVAVVPAYARGCSQLLPMDTSCAGYIAFRYGWIPCLLYSLFLASQSLSGKRRVQWLEARAGAERLRQLFFQHAALWFAHLTSSDQGERELALKDRKRALEIALARVNPNDSAVLKTIVSDTDHTGWQIATPPTERATSDPDWTVAEDLLRYFRERRLQFQSEHAGRMLDEQERDSSQSVALRLNRHNTRIRFCSVGFVIFQMITVVLFLTADLSPSSDPIRDAQLAAASQAIALVFAALIVALRVIEDGTHLRGDIMRYRTYAGVSVRIAREIEAVNLTTKTGRSRITGTLMAMEELAYWELREFLTLHQESSFSS